MQKVATGYTMYFNTKNERSGALFQGKYKIKHIEEDIYLKYLFEYIHLNPIREEFDTIDQSLVDSLIEKLERNPLSSLSVYSGSEENRLAGSVLDKKLFEELFPSYMHHRLALLDWKDDFSELFGRGRTLSSLPKNQE